MIVLVIHIEKCILKEAYELAKVFESIKVNEQNSINVLTKAKKTILVLN